MCYWNVGYLSLTHISRNSVENSEGNDHIGREGTEEVC
jgi:hypothetical protein